MLSNFEVHLLCWLPYAYIIVLFSYTGVHKNVLKFVQPSLEFPRFSNFYIETFEIHPILALLCFSWKG